MLCAPESATMGMYFTLALAIAGGLCHIATMFNRKQPSLWDLLPFVSYARTIQSPSAYLTKKGMRFFKLYHVLYISAFVITMGMLYIYLPACLDALKVKAG